MTETEVFIYTTDIQNILQLFISCSMFAHQDHPQIRDSYRIYPKKTMEKEFDNETYALLEPNP